ncbi:hypothetical protein ACJIZ3_008522 [Penstemon smallii]|uniref:RING-type domain-containing protein n=1 Tax=Penstemon smallii TaxID=265156 RepID=A0ABD3TAX9_9LAMI
MAVEARHLNLFPSQIVQDRELVTPFNQGNVGSAFNAQPMRFSGNAFGTTLPGNNNSNSVYQQVVCDSVQPNTDSGVTFNISAPRKRSRESMNQFYGTPNFIASSQKNNGVALFPSSFVGEDLLPQIHQNQLEIDDIISQHTKKIRLELEQRQNQQAKFLAAAIGQGVMKKLKEKEDQIQRIAKSNLFLQERVKSLYVENQLWRDLAQSNEATANTLRSNLEQVLSHIGEEPRATAVEDDAESCCGSTGDEKEGEESNCYSDRRCRNCGERESCVLLLPCRHLCLCNVCGSGSHQIQACPVCNSIMNATLHVNMSA